MRINYKHLAIGGLALNLSIFEMSPSHAAKQRMVCPSDGKRPMFNVICPGGDEPIPIEEYNGSRPPPDSGGASITTTGTGSKSRRNCSRMPNGKMSAECDTGDSDTGSRKRNCSRMPNGKMSADCEPPPRQSFEPEMVSIPAGCFQMGSPESELGRDDSEGPQHRVCIDGFQMGKYEVTQGEWQVVMGNNPSHFKDCGKRCPVEEVYWNDVQEYIRKLNAKTGKTYRLPTEAEWEYACRGGLSNKIYCGGNNIDTVGWYDGNSNHNTHEVGKKQSNVFGIYDMSGNVYEWTCSDYTQSYDGSEKECSGNEEKGSLRGGSWSTEAVYCRSAERGGRLTPTYDYGVRVVMPVVTR